MSTNYKTTSAIELQNVIKQMGPNLVGLELGVWYGVNAGHILEDCPNVAALYGVDPYIPYQDWNRFIGQDLMDQAFNSATDIFNSFGTRASLIKMTSEQAADLLSNYTRTRKLDFIFIDGDHSYERCYDDLNLWYDQVRTGGLFSGHDFSLPGVNRALSQFRQEKQIKGYFKVIPNDVWYWIKD